MSTINSGNFAPEPLVDAATEPAPIIVDLGRHKAKAVKQLKKGKGKLLDEIYTTIEELRTVGTISGSAQPVIVIVQEKTEVQRLFPMLPI
jgi:hypothetical protein